MNQSKTVDITVTNNCTCEFCSEKVGLGDKHKCNSSFRYSIKNVPILCFYCGEDYFKLNEKEQAVCGSCGKDWK